MLLPLSRLLRFTQLAALLILLGLGALLYHYIDHFNAAEQRVEHTHGVIGEMYEARLAALRSEMWIRVYAAEPTAQTLERVRSFARQAMEAVRRVEERTRDTPQQNLKARRLVGDMEELLERYLSRTNLPATSPAQALGPLQSPAVRENFTRQVREQLEEMAGVELRLLQAETELEKQHLRQLKQLLVGSSIVLGAILLWSMWYSTQLFRLRKAALVELETQAALDPLTGLLNRREFQQRFARALEEVLQGQQQAAVLAFDLDDFKPVNDRHGHAAGDKVLQVVSERVRHQCRGKDLIARMGGDEFVVVLASVASPEETFAIATRLRAKLREPMEVGAAQVQIGTSIGIAMVPADGRDPEALLKVADQGLYRAKRSGKGSVEFGGEPAKAPPSAVKTPLSP